MAYDAEFGTLLRTCDAVGACMAVPDTAHYRRCLSHGDPLPRRPHIHWLGASELDWDRERAAGGSRILAVELGDDATP